jgi:RNA recognition motif-containing protein
MDERDAADAVRELHGREVFGRRIKVEFAKSSRDRDRTQEVRQRASNPECRVLLTGLTIDTSWQDLKDLGRETGNVTFSDVTKVNDGKVGVLEFENKDMAQAAIRKLDGAKLKGNTVKAEDETPDRTYRSLVEASRGQSRRDGGSNGGSGSSSGAYGGSGSGSSSSGSGSGTSSATGAYGVGAYGAGSSSSSSSAYGSESSSSGSGAYGTESAHDDSRRSENHGDRGGDNAY